MEQELTFKKVKVLELINPTEENILQFAKKFRIKEIDLRNSLTISQYAEFISEKNYLAFRLIYPVFRQRYIHFEHVGLFLTKNRILLLRKEDREIHRIKTKTLAYLQKSKVETDESFVTFFVFSLTRRYLPLLRKLSRELTHIESKLKTLPPLETIDRIAQIRRNLVFAHTTTKSILDAINQAMKSGLPIIKKYFDRWEMVQDNTIFILEKLEDFEKILEGLNQSFESRLSLQINESVKILTVIQAIFLPAMLISSIYGMNIGLPLAKIRFAFWILIAIMAILTILFIKLIRKI